MADNPLLGFVKGSKDEAKASALLEKRLSGALPLEEMIVAEAKLLKGIPEKMAEEVAENAQLFKGARDAVAYLKRRGCKVVGISADFFPTMGYLQTILGLDELIANELEVKNGTFTGKLSGRKVCTDDSKPEILKTLMTKYEVSRSEVVVIGSSKDDLKLLRQAGLSIAFNSNGSLLKHADVVIDKKDVREIIPYITGDSPTLSSSDVSVLKHLQEDASQPLRQLGAQLKMSPAGVSKKINRLVKKGIISRFTVDVSKEQLGVQTAFIMARHTPSAIKRSAEKFADNDHVTECYSTVDGRMLVKVIDHESMMEETLAHIFETLRNEGHEVSELMLPKVHKNVREVPHNVLLRQLA